jgi:hypothetical protein
MPNFREPLAIAAQDRRATSSEDREHSGLQRYKACQFTRRMIIAPYVCCVRDEVIPSRGEIAAARATIGQKPVIGSGHGHGATPAPLPEGCLRCPLQGQAALCMSSAFLMTMA